MVAAHTEYSLAHALLYVRVEGYSASPDSFPGRGLILIVTANVRGHSVCFSWEGQIR